MKILIACEYSGVVRDAFAKRGHDAISCDLLPTDAPGKHYQGSVLDILGDGFDMLIAHPPCTFLCVTGNRWMKPEYAERFPTRPQDRLDAIDFFKLLAEESSIPKVCVENPVGIMSRLYRKPDQIIQPYEFGHEEAKKTCLWLTNLPLLTPTKLMEPKYTTYKSGKRVATWYADAVKLAPKERMKLRSKTFQGIADAMAEQWG